MNIYIYIYIYIHIHVRYRYTHTWYTDIQNETTPSLSQQRPRVPGEGKLDPEFGAVGLHGLSRS